MNAVLKAWLNIPAPVRAGVRWGVRACGLSEPVLRRLGGWPMPDDFRPASFHTPPAVEASIARIAAEGLAGDYYEFGLWRGYTFCQAQKKAQECGLTQMRFWGFDSFAGLPEAEAAANESEYPKEAMGALEKGDFSCSRSQVEAYLAQYGVDRSRTELIEGFYDQTLTAGLAASKGMAPVAVALVDCDLYVSTVPVLKFLGPLLQDGSIILFDDWNIFGESNEVGERKAFAEFLEANSGWRAEPYVTFGWHGQGFVMRRNP